MSVCHVLAGVADVRGGSGCGRLGITVSLISDLVGRVLPPDNN